MLSSGGLAKIKKANLKRMKPVAGKPRLGPCVGNARNFIAIGLNYSDHAAEAGMPIPKEPIIFNKAPTCICGPNDDTIIPRSRPSSTGRSSSASSSASARAISQGQGEGRDRRLLPQQRRLRAGIPDRARRRQWNKGKGFENFGPIGPWIVTKDEIKEPQGLDWGLRSTARCASAATRRP